MLLSEYNEAHNYCAAQQKPKEIVSSARGWVGTKFSHQGRRKKTTDNDGGIDCLGLIVGIAHELALPSNLTPSGLLADADILSYPQIPNGKLLRSKLQYYLQEKNTADIGIGDIALFNIDGNPQHLAIIADYQSTPASNTNPIDKPKTSSIQNLSMIHAWSPNGKVVEHLYNIKWQRRLDSIYQFRI